MRLSHQLRNVVTRRLLEHLCNVVFETGSPIYYQQYSSSSKRPNYPQQNVIGRKYPTQSPLYSNVVCGGDVVGVVFYA